VPRRVSVSFACRQAAHSPGAEPSLRQAASGAVSGMVASLHCVVSAFVMALRLLLFPARVGRGDGIGLHVAGGGSYQVQDCADLCCLVSGDAR
jgi:hypothetical protein